jgi:hypothetical protein
MRCGLDIHQHQDHNLLVVRFHVLHDANDDFEHPPMVLGVQMGGDAEARSVVSLLKRGKPTENSMSVGSIRQNGQTYDFCSPNGTVGAIMASTLAEA